MGLYAALIVGTGEGCDYTLGCNKTWVIKEAETIDDFRMSVLEDFGMLNFGRKTIPDILIEKMDIFEICGETQSVTGIPEWFFEEVKKSEVIKKEEKERELYEKLKRKFED